jgi:hypothetical protein
MAVKNFTMDDAVEEMLSNITIRFSTEDDDKNSVDALFVSYVGPDPEASKAVAQSLVERLLASHREDLHRRLMGSLTFVQDELHKLSFRLAEEGRELAREKAANGTAATSMLALDYELRQSTYRSLFARNEELQLLASIYQRRGGMLQIVDPPQLGIPVEPNRMAFAIVGAIAGVVLGGAAFMGINRRQRRALA